MTETRNTRIAVSEEELESFKHTKQILFEDMADDIAHGAALMRICERIEEQEQYL
jgi:hypothetical protein